MPNSPFSLAPKFLSQAINPWTFDGSQFGFFNIIIGQSPRPDVESAILQEVGSYGRQLGRMGDAMAVLLRHMDRAHLTEAEREAILLLEAQLLEVRHIKQRGD